jgi:predicted nucleic acid-binding protein
MSQQLIFDTSVWIDFLRNKDIQEVALLTDYIKNNHQVILIPTILQEVLQGIRNDAHYLRVKDIFSYFTILQIQPVEAAIEAAELYRSLRKKGLTIRKSNYFLIAYHAIKFSIPLVHLDTDFDVIGKHSKLEIWKSRM